MTATSFAPLTKFPDMAGTGNFFAGTGNFSDGTGNFSDGTGNFSTDQGIRQMAVLRLGRRGAAGYRSSNGGGPPRWFIAGLGGAADTPLLRCA
jgi:hypothetical protein